MHEEINFYSTTRPLNLNSEKPSPKEVKSRRRSGAGALKNLDENKKTNGGFKPVKDDE